MLFLLITYQLTLNFTRRLTTEQPNHPLVVDVSNKTDLFDRAAAKYNVPPIATAA